VPLTAGTVRAEIGRRSAWFWGPDVTTAVRAIGCPHMFCPTGRGIAVPNDFADQVIDYLGAKCNRHVVRVVVDR
jgi:hypothetical protein